MVSPSASSASVSVSFQTDTGAISTAVLPTLPANGHMAFVLPQQFSPTSGNRGLAEFYSANGSLAIIALRANPTGAFTSAPIYIEAGPPVIAVQGSNPPGTLFFDDFSGAFPGKNWIIVGGSPTIDPNVGNPPPSLSLHTDTLQSAVNPFDSTSGLTFSFDVGSPQGSGTVVDAFLQDQNTGVPASEITIDNFDCIATYNFAAATHLGVIQPFNCDSSFHTFTFRVDAAGNAAWLRDGIQQASFAGFSDKSLIIRILAGVLSGQRDLGAHLDNISVRVL